jgi:hypothetical protein
VEDTSEQKTNIREQFLAFEKALDLEAATLVMDADQLKKVCLPARIL